MNSYGICDTSKWETQNENVQFGIQPMFDCECITDSSIRSFSSSTRWTLSLMLIHRLFVLDKRKKLNFPFIKCTRSNVKTSVVNKDRNKQHTHTLAVNHTEKNSWTLSLTLAMVNGVGEGEIFLFLFFFGMSPTCVSNGSNKWITNRQHILFSQWLFIIIYTKFRLHCSVDVVDRDLSLIQTTTTTTTTTTRCCRGWADLCFTSMPAITNEWAKPRKNIPNKWLFEVVMPTAKHICVNRNR